MAQDLKDELEAAIESSSRLAKRSYFFAQTLFIVSILSSFFASILAAGSAGDKLFFLPTNCLVAILAALPGTALLINNSFRFEERTKWFWKKVRMSEKLLRALRDSPDANKAEISAKFSEKMEELESEWPAMDSPTKQPKK